MASNFNVTTKQYNGSDYDTLYPKTVSQQTLLNDEYVKQLIGLTQGDPSVLDALSKMQTNLNYVVSCSNFPEIVSYVGDGQSSGGSITFTRAPSVVFWIGAKTAGNDAVPLITNRGQTVVYPVMLATSPNGTSYGGFQRISDSSSYQSWSGSKSADGKTINWWGGNTVAEGLNEAGTTYYFLGFLPWN